MPSRSPKNSLRNIKLTIAYDGTRYAGWQVQKNAVSVQEIIEKALAQITGAKVSVRGSGRTDAGVHARAQVATCKTASSIGLDRLQMALNTTLPKDVVITAVDEVPLDFNAQLDARGKTYRYTIVNNNFVDPFSRLYAAKVFYRLDLARMRRAARLMEGRHDFRAFQAQDRTEKDAVRTVRDIRIARSGDRITIDIEANGFVYNMVRNMVGTLVEIGRGRFSVERVGELFRTRDRKLCGPAMPARGLCLEKVTY